MKQHNPSAYHAAQIPVLGTDGLNTFVNSRCHVSGTGRIGTAVITSLIASGLGYISANDPQSVTEENLGPFIFTRPPDLGKPKVEVLERFLHGRSNCVFEPVMAETEAAIVDPYLSQADFIVSCANSLPGRLAAERKAIELRKPVMQVASFDGREQLGGMITLRLPSNDWAACFGCLCGSSDWKVSRGEGLLSTTTAALGVLAANMVVQILTGTRTQFLTEHTCHFIDLETYSISSLSVQRRPNCPTCGNPLGNAATDTDLTKARHEDGTVG